MSMTIGEYTVKSPYYSEGWRRGRRVVGGDWLFLNVSRGKHYMGAHWAPTFTWRVWDDEYDTLMAALLVAEQGAVTVADDLGNTGTFMLETKANNPDDRWIGGEVHEVRADFIEVKGVG